MLRSSGDWKQRFCQRRSLAGFFLGEAGYALALALVSLPFLIGVAAWIIDAARVTNLHTDLQNAVDAMALAGARELDGRDDAIARAKTAIAEIQGNKAWFGNTGGASGLGSVFDVVYSATAGGTSDVDVYFLGAIPASDDTPIAAGACTITATTQSDCQVKGSTDAEKSNNAKYVRVVAKTVNVDTIFPLPGIGDQTVPVSVEAVATYTAAACDVTPIFICNPYESYPGNTLANGKTFNQNFADGDLYARQFIMSDTGSASPAPGNFGFLRVGDNFQGKADLARALATNNPGMCYTQAGVDTEPGAGVGPVENGLNTRMGLYGANFQSYTADYAYRPDINTRKGQQQSGATGKTTEDCKSYKPETDTTKGMAFPTGNNVTSIGGGSVSTNSWNLTGATGYWQVSHGAGAVAPTAMPSLPSDATVTPPQPSRYDIYQYELDHDLYTDASPNGETGDEGANQCYKGSTAPTKTDQRRVIFSAVLNCAALAAAGEMNGAATDLPVEAFASMFMTKPVITSGSTKEIYLEITDVTGAGGRGTLDNFLREESELVR